LARQKDGFSRREFIQRSAQGAAGLASLPIVAKAAGGVQADPMARPAANPQDKSRVVVVSHQNALNGNAFNADVIQTMMDAGITRLTGIDDVGEAWKSLFPGIVSSSVIGIKVNCLFVQCTHPPVTNAIVSGLTRMVVDGNPFPENNIIVWDRSDGELRSRGYTINNSNTGVRCFGTREFNTKSYPIDDASNQKLSSILTNTCQFLINASALKNHGTGVSLSMKNHYGSISNVNGTGMHNYPCSRVLPSLNSLAPIREKQKICICDAIMACVNNGPDGNPTTTPKSLILSQDPVAHDFTGAQMLTALGGRNSDPVTGAAKHITVASQPPYSLGTCDPDQIERIEIVDPEPISSAVEVQETSGLPGGFALFQNHPNPFNGTTWISYRLPHSADVRIRILDVRGRTIRRLFDGAQAEGTFQAAWDGTSDAGNRVSSGMYLAELVTGASRATIKMQLVQ
jgi:uncharacterized protein (DUF362 family)